MGLVYPFKRWGNPTDRNINEQYPIEGNQERLKEMSATSNCENSYAQLQGTLKKKKKNQGNYFAPKEISISPETKLKRTKYHHLVDKEFQMAILKKFNDL